MLVHTKDLKTANFERFFNNTQLLCQHHLGEEAGRSHFSLLASQLIQRMLKSSSQTKTMKDPAKDFPFAVKFVQALHDALSNNDDLLDGSCEDNMNVSLAILNVMDLRTPPSQVNNAVQLLNSSSHWLASAFKLDKGKRMTQLSLENAANRENQNGILEKIGEHTSALEEQAITDENDLSGDPLGAAYGKLLLDCSRARDLFTL